jgi:hypothetical protein
VSPTRVLDNRTPPIGVAAAGPLGPRGTIELPLTTAAPNRPGIPVPAGAVSVLLNVTVDFDATAPSFITVWPTGSPQPTTSVINPEPGTVVAGSILVPLGTGGKVSIFNFAGDVHVIVDLSGYTMALTGGGAVGLQGPPGPPGPPGAPGKDAETVVNGLSDPWQATNQTVSLTPDGVEFGPYADGGAAGGSLLYTGLNGQPLSAVTALTYYMRYVSTGDTGGVGAPYLRIFTTNDTHDAIFSPNTQSPDKDVAEGPFHEWVATSGSWRYDDDPGNGPDMPFADLITAHGTDVISGIVITTGFSAGTDLAALLRWIEINGQKFMFRAA